ncbi:MAG: MBL fold metallo-hydrolase, partial [Clostridia bacterium]|nr:MBL fold metallo-hydrolase [Clostridia bacterium]
EQHTLKDDQSFELFGATIRCFATQHPFETYGLRIEQDGKVLATTADTVPCANLAPLLRAADLALMDAGSLERLRTPAMVHLTAAECGQIASDSHVHRLLLIHLLPFYVPEESLAEARTHFPGAEIAQPGRTYAI